MRDFNFLITGGSGFIGSSLAERLLKTGATVVCLDINNSDRLTFPGKQLKQVKGDVLDAKRVDHWVGRCERVIHLAAIAGVDEYITRPFDVLDVNIMGTRNVLLSCLKRRRPVLFSSSSEIYGMNTGALEETSSRVYGPSSNHRWSYAISKSAGEHYAYALGEQGLIFAIVRYFNVYGPKLDSPGSGRVVSKFIGCIQDHRPLTLVDGGDAARTFCYVDDAVEATARLAMKLKPDAPFRNTAVNIGRDEPATIKELADMMIRLTGHPYGTKNVPGEVFFGKGFEEIPHRMPDISKQRQFLDFEPKVDLEEGLKRVLNHWDLLADQQREKKQPPAPRPTSLIPMVRPCFEPGDRLLQSYQRLLAIGPVTNCGPRLQKFEQEIAAYLDAPDVAVVSSGSDALCLSLKALGVKGKAVLPSYTFIATLNAVTACGLDPIFCDIDPDTFTLSPGELRKILRQEEGISCVIPVNVFGVPPEMEKIAHISHAAGIHILYDNAHGFGTRVDNKQIISDPIIQTLSFHATKLLPAIEGGAVVSLDGNILKEIRRLRNHGIASRPTASSEGINSKMDELRAATGSHVLKRFPQMLTMRRDYGRRIRSYITEYGDGIFVPQRIPDNVASNFQNMGIVCPEAERIGGLNIISKKLKRFGVESRSYFNPALHHLNAYENKFSLPVTDKIWRSLLCFPIHSVMSRQELCQIRNAVRSTAAELRQMLDSTTKIQQ
ncbi:conserved hypothetical protein [Candidatus Desulfarcum epimagneticum]|uniref:NAD-dependent epimerase/dehydratase domain-containing protein n=1 Tax=uncultured Desulfobacteraceae bacterium TaxID=218296 RepID=A0A484HE78_9BACT|nr:conserved hypothetical protein [uncultured Desulfobacteraceae bacterium]